jgi:hypothetical protein
MAKRRASQPAVGKRRSADEIAAKLRRADQMLAVHASEAEIARTLGISVRTYRSWRKKAPAGYSAVAAQARASAGSASLGARDSDPSLMRGLVSDLIQSHVHTAQYLVDKGEELLRLGHAHGLAAEALVAMGHEFLTKAVELETKRQRRRRE